jgi:hypothetical protein
MERGSLISRWNIALKRDHSTVVRDNLLQRMTMAIHRLFVIPVGLGKNKYNVL